MVALYLEARRSPLLNSLQRPRQWSGFFEPIRNLGLYPILKLSRHLSYEESTVLEKSLSRRQTRVSFAT